MIKLSLIIPAYNEASKIEKDILLADEFLQKNNLYGEIIVVDDGSEDNTIQLAHELKRKIASELVILSNAKNFGKGYSVKHGVLKARGEFIAFCDAGATVPYGNLHVGLNMLFTDECDIAHGSRMMPGSKIVKPQAGDRRISSAIIRQLATNFLGIPKWLTDTQCGFKVYKLSVAKQLFTNLSTNGFIFELENILRALKLGYRIKEFPVEWRCDRDSRITLFKTPWRILIDLVRIKFMKLD